MVFLANLRVNLRVCLCSDLQVASAQTFDFPDISQTETRPEGGPGHRKGVYKNPHFRIGNGVLVANYFRMDTET